MCRRHARVPSTKTWRCGGIRLVEHNEVPRDLSQLGEFVTTIADHLRDSGLYSNAAKTMAASVCVLQKQLVSLHQSIVYRNKLRNFLWL